MSRGGLGELAVVEVEIGWADGLGYCGRGSHWGLEMVGGLVVEMRGG